MVEEILLYIFLAIFTGFFAGMLGIGGGVFLVPGLTFIFTLFDFDKSFAIKHAIATSLAVMVFTAISSSYVHFKKKHILFEIVKKMFFAIVLGTILGSFLTHLINEKYLRIFFAIFLFFVSMKMLIGFKKEYKRNKINLFFFNIVGFLIGLKSGILGVGGGTVSVPFLSYIKTPMRNAIGTSSFFTLIIGIVGSICFYFFGQNSNFGSLGYIYTPALVSVFPFTIISAYIGAKTTRFVNQRVLQIVFGFLLILVCMKMVFLDSILSFGF